MKSYISVPIIAAVIFAVCFFAMGHIIQTGDDHLQKIQWSCMWGGRGDGGPAGGPVAYSDGTQTIDDIICKWMPNEDYAKYYESRTQPPTVDSISP